MGRITSRKEFVNLLRATASRAGYELIKEQPVPTARPGITPPTPKPLTPVWPLPVREGVTVADLAEQFGRFEHWHYAYKFTNGFSVESTHIRPHKVTESPERPRQRFSHFMPDLVHACGGSLEGLRVLDIACNSGFWSIQAAMLGADVVGFDARPELIEQSNIVKDATGVDNVEFKLLNYFDMSPETLGTFDIVMNLGILYHLPDALDGLKRTLPMATKYVVLDTSVHVTTNPAVYLRWEEPYDIHAAADEGIVALPSRSAVDLMLQHLEVSSWYEIPLRSADVPLDYSARRRATWLITV